MLEKADLTVGQALNLPLSMKISGVEERVTITATHGRHSQDRIEHNAKREHGKQHSDSGTQV